MNSSLESYLDFVPTYFKIFHFTQTLSFIVIPPTFIEFSSNKTIPSRYNQKLHFLNFWASTLAKPHHPPHTWTSCPEILPPRTHTHFHYFPQAKCNYPHPLYKLTLHPLRIIFIPPSIFSIFRSDTPTPSSLPSYLHYHYTFLQSNYIFLFTTQCSIKWNNKNVTSKLMKITS